MRWPLVVLGAASGGGLFLACVGSDPDVVPSTTIIVVTDGSSPDLEAGSPPDSGGVVPQEAGTDAEAGGDPFPGRLVFVTSTTYAGDLKDQGVTGIASADAICTRLANNGHAFRAWLASSGMSAPSRFVDGKPWYDPLRNKIASYANLQATTVGHAIQVDERGFTVPTNDPVWTGTQPDGTVGPDSCYGWSDATTGVTGIVGYAGDSSGKWTSATPEKCLTQHRLYCFEY